MLNNQKLPKNRVINQLTQLEINNHEQNQYEAWKSINTKRIKAKNRFIHIDEDDSYLNLKCGSLTNFDNCFYDSPGTKLKKSCSASTGVFTTNDSIKQGYILQKQSQVGTNYLKQDYYSPKMHQLNIIQSPQNKKTIENPINKFQTPKKSEASTCFQSLLEQSIKKLKRCHTQPYEVKLKQLSLQQIMQNSQRYQCSHQQNQSKLLQVINQSGYFDEQHSIPLFTKSYHTQIIQNHQIQQQPLIDYNNYCYLCDEFATLFQTSHICKRKIASLHDISRSLQQITNMIRGTQMNQYKNFVELINKSNNYQQLRSLYEFLKIRSQKIKQQHKTKIQQIILKRLININGKKMGLVLIL